MRFVLPLLLLVGCKKTVDEVEDHYFTILHTNDWQSHFLGQGPNAEYSPDTTGDDSTIGGLARTKTLIDEIKDASDDPVLLFDGGDWMAGALFQLLAATESTELQMMDALEYDAIALGNHEFDWGPQALGQMIANADSLGVDVPILCSNLVPNTTDAGDDALEALLDSGRIESTRVETLDNGLSIGLFSLIGDEAATITPAVKPASFMEVAEAAADAVATLQGEGVDIIIALSHSGVDDDPANSPDHIIAETVPGIDIIVSGHTHTPMFEEQFQGDTVIVQAGAYNKYLGQLDLVVDGADGTVSVASYELHAIDDTIEGDGEITQMVDGFVDQLEAGPLVALGYTFDEPIVSIPGDITRESCAESGISNFITDAYLDQINAVAADPVQFAFQSQGVTRDDILAGSTGIQAFSDMFRVLPLGMGSDGVPGYGLVTFYVTAKELGDVCEVTASISPDYGCDYFIEAAGMRCTVDMSKGSFSRTTRVDYWDDNSQDWVELDTTNANEELYHVAVDSYVGSLMGVVTEMTFGAIAVQAKDANGDLYAGVEQMLFDADSTVDGVQELKLWQAIVGYALTFDDTNTDGIPDMPSRYLGPEGRILGYE